MPDLTYAECVEARQRALAAAGDDRLDTLYTAGVAFSRACLEQGSVSAALQARDALVRDLFGEEIIDRVTLDALYSLASRERSNRRARITPPGTFAQRHDHMIAAVRALCDE